MRQVLCTNCSDVAAEVPEHMYAEDVVRHYAHVRSCRHCGSPGSLEADDDGESARLDFVAVEDVRELTSTGLVATVLLAAHEESERQRRDGVRFLVEPLDLRMLPAQAMAIARWTTEE